MRDVGGDSVYEFYVGVTTHALLRRGVTVNHYTRVTVAANSHAQAACIAAEMAACGGWMPTVTVVVPNPEEVW